MIIFLSSLQQCVILNNKTKRIQKRCIVRMMLLYTVEEKLKLPAK